MRELETPKKEENTPKKLPPLFLTMPPQEDILEEEREAL